MKKILAALLGLAALDGIASAQTSSARIAYDVCYPIDWDYTCNIVAGGSVVVAATGQFSVSGPKWSPDGSRVAFVAGDILVVNLADGVIANLTNKTILMHARLAESITPFNQALADPAAAMLDPRTETGRALLEQIMTQQATIIAYANDFKLMMIMTMVAFPLIALIRVRGLGLRPAPAAAAE